MLELPSSTTIWVRATGKKNAAEENSKRGRNDMLIVLKNSKLYVWWFWSVADERLIVVYTMFIVWWNDPRAWLCVSAHVGSKTETNYNRIKRQNFTYMIFDNWILTTRRGRVCSIGNYVHTFEWRLRIWQMRRMANCESFSFRSILFFVFFNINEMCLGDEHS